MKQTFTLITLLLTVFQLSAQRQYFEKHTFNAGGHQIPYRLELPQNYNPDDTIKYPLILFLHGAGERGSDNEMQLTHIDVVFGSEDFRQNYPCFVLLPQCPEGERWVDVDWGLISHTIPQTMTVSLKLTMALLLRTIHQYNIDTTRIYVTGLSMGGFGTWDIIARFPKIFAAAIPICGGADENTADKIVDIPIWAFHGAKDKVVTVDRTRNMIAAIGALGGNPKYTEFPNLGHLCWNAAYATTGLWDWLFSQKITIK